MTGEQRIGKELMESFESDDWNCQREALEIALFQAAEALMQHSGSAGASLENEAVKVELRIQCSPIEGYTQ